MFHRLSTAAAVGLAAVAFAFLASSSASAGGGGGGCTALTTGEGVEVGMSRSCFSPVVLHISAGDSVTWVNNDPFAHAVTGVASSFGDYVQLWQDDRVTHRFDEPGVYPYFCFLHPSMVGAVVVEARADAEQVAAVEPSVSSVHAIAAAADGMPWYAVEHALLIEAMLADGRR
jgi:plastocyanin